MEMKIKEETLDWLYRLKSQIYVYMPKEWLMPMNNALDVAIKALEQEPMEKCKWIKYDYRTMCPKKHTDVDNPYWRIPENRMETLKYCPYCGKEIEVEE